MEKIGLIAGNRRLPILFAEAARKRNCHIVAVAIRGDTSPKLKGHVDKIYWLNLSDFSRMFEIFKNEGITKIVMAGQITPTRLFSRELEKDSSLKDLLKSIRDKKADTVFGAVAQKLQESGLQLMDSTIFLEGFLPKKGTLTEREPTSDEWQDIHFGLDLAKEIAFLDIGQTVAVKNKAIVAVEALEGTDKLIQRAGKLSKGGAVIVKVSKPKQDRRFDMPVVGLNTIKNLIKAGAPCLAIEAGKTLFIDKSPSLGLANRYKLSIAAV
jgi:DUF1009 family protein